MKLATALIFTTLCLVLGGCLEAGLFRPERRDHGRGPGNEFPNDGNATTYQSDELVFSSQETGVRTNVYHRAKYVQYSKLLMPFHMDSETTFQILNGRITSRSSDGISAHFPSNIVYQILTFDKKIRVGEIRQGQSVQLEPHADYFLSLCYPLDGPKACENVPSNYFPGTIKEFDLQLILWRGQGQAPTLELVCESDSGRTFVLNSEQISEVGGGPYFNKTHACGDSKKIETMHSTFMLSDDLKDWPRPSYSSWSVPAAQLTFPFHYYSAWLQYEPQTRSLMLACSSVEVFSYDQDERAPDFSEKIQLRACSKQLRF